jgi:hypothetical protein
MEPPPPPLKFERYNNHLNKSPKKVSEESVENTAREDKILNGRSNK